MCGITGYVGPRPAQDLLLDGLARLEYRGYDSAGVSLLRDRRIESVRAVGNLAALRDAVADRPDGATTGIGHTRWATHGAVSERNAHPLADPSGRVHIVLNGIVENFAELRGRLAAVGHEFSSETDAEVVAHLIARRRDGDDLADAVRAACDELRGHFAFVALDADAPGRLVAARRECPLVIGHGDGETFVASDVPAFLAETDRVAYLEDGDVATVSPEGVAVVGDGGVRVQRDVVEVDWDAETAEKAGYESFMRKEIHQQPEALAETLADRLGSEGLGEDVEALIDGVERVIVVGCGTSYHAGLFGRQAIEEWARIPCEVDVASERRYRDAPVGPADLVVGVTQSGETADTLAAMRQASAAGVRVVAITNVLASQAARDADAVLDTRAGLEVGVAATKTFVAQVAALLALARRLGERRGTLTPERADALAGALRALPQHVERAIERTAEPVDALARACADAEFFLYLGRHAGLPAALEGALKLKEISYVPTDAYAAGEMKHGPIALLSEGTPVVCVATDGPVLDKLVSNVQEVQARGARVVAVVTKGSAVVAEHAQDAVAVPATGEAVLDALVAVVPLQLLAYGIARARGLDTDQPRNLAKTVTVE